MELSVIIVNYNVKYFLEQALLSVVRASTDLSVEIFVVDNNSVDDSVSMVREKFPKVIMIANAGNPGFSVANNQAIRQAKGKYILLLNPDTVVEENTFKICLDFMNQHPQAGGVGVKMIDGSGNFLPESKRGFPSPFVAFCKTFGLSSLFPKSKTFNRYHLGFLNDNENHEVEVLAGAFMWLRRSVLDEVGLLDEAFFMYGEDIDLSYRIVKGGYKNYYVADTRIIHYKGESTKKGSLNYVKTFYNAMIIFARKHFQGERAWLYIMMLKLAIYFRAGITLVGNFIKKAYFPLLDALAIVAGLLYLKKFWATYYFKTPDYYDNSFLYVNIPLYLIIWLTTAYFSGAYDRKNNIKQLIRGLLIGTFILAAVYGFLDLEYRSSRIIIILGAIWAMLSTVCIRFLHQFITHRNLNLDNTDTQNMVIVGAIAESQRVQTLVHQSGARKNFIGTVAPDGIDHQPEIYLSTLTQLDEVVHIYKIDEIIFCSENISAQDIMEWMTRLGPKISYKIVPKESLSIIGSNSKNNAGELYTIDIQFSIADFRYRRSKRLMDILLGIGGLLLAPILVFIIKNPFGFLRNCLQIILNKKTWVGYHPQTENKTLLPKIKPGVVTPVDELTVSGIDEPTIRRLNFFYAKDYTISKDIDILLSAFRKLGS